MEQHLDLERFPLHDLTGERGRALIADCKAELAACGMFNLPGFLRPAAVARCVAEVGPLFRDAAFFHKRSHNIYFDDDISGLPPGHPALARVETTNHTLCADQVADSLICAVYEWPPLADFIAAVLEKPRLHVMADPLARANVMAYEPGEALNWHFDRSEFTTTLLLQAPEVGGEFQYRPALRSDDDPNYEGVARLLRGEDPRVETLTLTPGTLNVFKGRNTAHRVTPPKGGRPRIIAVFSYYERPGVTFSDAERIGFYGRAA
jgi:hypothetical protein